MNNLMSTYILYQKKVNIAVCCAIIIEQVLAPNERRVIEIPCSSSNSLMRNINRDADSDCDGMYTIVSYSYWEKTLIKL